MRFKAALFYQNAIAFYSVYLLDGNTYKAKLDEYSGVTLPPSLISLKKSNKGWQSDCNDNEIITELRAAIEFKKID